MQDGVHFTATQLVRAGVFLCSSCMLRNTTNIISLCHISCKNFIRPSLSVGHACLRVRPSFYVLRRKSGGFS
jgi:hypothetical protein